MNSVPRWVLIYTAIAALMGLAFSAMFISSEGLAFAARNAAPAIASIAILIWARNTPAGYFAVMLARATIELGDTISGLASGDTMTLAFAAVMLILDIAAIVVLFPKLRSS